MKNICSVVHAEISSLVQEQVTIWKKNSKKFYMIVLEKINICTCAWMLYQLVALKTFLSCQSLIPQKLQEILHFEKEKKNVIIVYKISNENFTVYDSLWNVAKWCFKSKSDQNSASGTSDQIFPNTLCPRYNNLPYL